ncbi:ribokinase [Sphingopyxis sp. 550A]
MDNPKAGSEPITVVGSINRDIVVRCRSLPRAGETVAGSALSYGSGGKGANQAVAASRLGGTVRMIGRVGADAWGRTARGVLRSAGCDISGVRQAGQLSGQALVTVDRQGANSIVVIEAANGLLSADQVRRDEKKLKEGGVILLQLEIPLEAVSAAAMIAHAAGGRVILDPGPARDLPRDLLRRISVITPNQTELEVLTGQKKLRDGELVEAAEHLRSSGPETVIVKLGAEGCLVIGDGPARQLAAPHVDVVDTTGAGDVFNAALAVRLSEGAPIEAGVEFALAAASLSVTRFGAQSAAPTRAEVVTFIQGTPT